MKKETYFPSDWMVYQAAKMYFIDGMQQKDICNAMGISAATVSRLIQRAQKEHIISVSLKEPYVSMLETAEKLKARYGLREVIIAPFPNPSHPEISDSKHAAALEGARYLQRILKPNDIVGLAWGGTMSLLIHYLNPCQKTEASFVTMHGSIACCDFDLDVQTLTARAAMALGGTKNCLFSNGLLDSTETVRQLKSEKGIRSIFELFDKITISVSGLGVHTPESASLLFRAPYLTDPEYRELLNAGVCGDIMLRFIDRNGKECDTELKDRTLSIDLDTYRKIPTKIIVAASAVKAFALHTVLQNGFCDVIIIDLPLGEALLRQDFA